MWTTNNIFCGGDTELVDNNSGIGLEVESSWARKTPKTSKIVSGMKKVIENKKLMSAALEIEQ